MPNHLYRASPRDDATAAAEALGLPSPGPRHFPSAQKLHQAPERPGVLPRHVGRLILLVLCVLLPACNDSRKAVVAPSPTAVERTFERGPVTVVMRLDNPTPSIADRITLEIEVTSGEDYEVVLPGFGERLEQFGIVDFLDPQPELLEDGKVRKTKGYVLEPFLSGDYVIPPMTIQFRKQDGSDDKTHELVTEELQVVVSSLLPEDAENLEIHDIAPPMELPKEQNWHLWPRVIKVVLGLTALAIALIVKFRKKTKPLPPPRPAHEIAFEDLEKLVADDLPGAGRIKEFYQRISDILRHYIENRFGLHAPDRTTEEFLAELGSGDALNQSHQPLLGNFLQHCDLVKFAEHQPAVDDIQNTFDSCKNFIIATQEDAPSRPPPPDPS